MGKKMRNSRKWEYGREGKSESEDYVQDKGKIRGANGMRGNGKSEERENGMGIKKRGREKKSKQDRKEEEIGRERKRNKRKWENGRRGTIRGKGKRRANEKGKKRK